MVQRNMASHASPFVLMAKRNIANAQKGVFEICMTSPFHVFTMILRYKDKDITILVAQ
jgi:hypothetical protein